MTLIAKDGVNENGYDLVTSKGRAVHVLVSFELDYVIVSVSQNGSSRLAVGKMFAGNGFNRAIAAYKSADVREALEALRDEVAA